MAPEPMRVPAMRAFALLALLVVSAGSAHAFRIVNHNILNYPGNTSAARNPLYRTIYAPLNADIVVTEEMATNTTFPDSTGSILFRDQVLNALEPGAWAMAPWIDGNDTDSELYYRRDKFTLIGRWAFYPNPANQLRYVHVFRLRPTGYANGEIRIYSQHLKASSGSANAAQRLAEATGIRDSMNAVPPGTSCLLMGDFNIYSGSEGAFVKLLEVQADNDGRLYDPLNAPAITWNTGSLAAMHTQSPCNGSGCASGAATGGMDDRFDMILPTLDMGDGEGYDLVTGSYVSVGNDGLHYNLAITDAPVIPEGAAYAAALLGTSDHLPVRVDIQRPAQSTAPAALAFGPVIVGAPNPVQTLAITNSASTGATDFVDELNYSLSASAGFTAPAGSFVVNPGAASSDAIAMDASTAGARAGTLTVTSDDPDHATRSIALSGTVLRHAVASLDSAALATTALLDFGTHPAGEFGTLDTRLHDLGWDALQARLDVVAGAITGGAGRFSIVGGFAPALLAGVGRTYTVAFDDAGATVDSTYEATLTFSSADEGLPGALPATDAVVTLRARVQSSGNVGTPGLAAPTATLLFAPAPNPLTSESRVRFDMAQRGRVSLAAFDLAGRRVATLLDGAVDAGRYSVSWNGHGESGMALGSGLYFLRMSVDGRPAQTVRLAIVR